MYSATHSLQLEIADAHTAQDSPNLYLTLDTTSRHHAHTRALIWKRLLLRRFVAESHNVSDVLAQDSMPALFDGDKLKTACGAQRSRVRLGSRGWHDGVISRPEELDGYRPQMARGRRLVQ